jgi:hypothetical protein
MNYNHKERANQGYPNNNLSNQDAINKQKNINRIWINIENNNRDHNNNIYTNHQNNYTLSNVSNNTKKIKIPISNKATIKHLIILVHGYQACRQDFQVLKLCL